MVDEALTAYLESALPPSVPPFSQPEPGKDKIQQGENGGMSDRTVGLRSLLAYNNEPPQFSEAETSQIIAAIDNVKVLDPACGSGAFPMGILHKLVYILSKLDPHNERWEQQQISKASEIQDVVAREAAIQSIEQVFADNYDDYGRKLYLIENCIYGVDIQPIAVQIAKLRFFISLVVDQKTNLQKANLGIRPLPNLETKFVAANTLIGIARPESKTETSQAQDISSDEKIKKLFLDLRKILDQFYIVKSDSLKEKYRQYGKEVCDEINLFFAARDNTTRVDFSSLFSGFWNLDAARRSLPDFTRTQTGNVLALRNQEIEAKEKELERVRREHFSARTPATKLKYRDLDKKLRQEIADLLSKNHALEDATAQQLAGWDPYNQNAYSDFFDPEWMFGIESGFDVVIGNPPYISALEFSKIYGYNTRADLNARYNCARGSYDIFVLFIEKGLKLTAQNGSLVFITPNKYLSANYAVALRELILGNYALVHIVDLSSIRVFEEASVYPVVSVIRNAPETRTPVKTLLPAHENKFDIFEPSEFMNVEIQRSMLRLLPENLWGFLLSNNAVLLSKIVVGTNQLHNLGEVNATSTAGEADAYGKHVTEKSSKDSMKIINTGTIDKWTSLWGKEMMTNAGNRYSTPFLNLKMAGVNDRRKEMYQAPKIIVAKMARVCEAFLDIEGEYASLNTNCFYKPKEGVSLKSEVVN
jgi:hypothetical protein